MRERIDIEKSLLRKGFVRSGRKRDHDYYFFDHRGLTTSLYTKISRGSSYKTYSDSLLAAMAHQLNLSKSQLLRLIDCPMTKEEFVKNLMDKRIIDLSGKP